MKLRRYTNRGELLPRGYGVAWHDPCFDRAVCYPFPFHKPIGWLRRWYWDVIQPPRSPHCDRLKLHVQGLEERARVYQEDARLLAATVRRYQQRDAQDEEWARELFKTVRNLDPLQ